LNCSECGSDNIRSELSDTSGCDTLFAVLVGIPMILLGWMNEWWLLVLAGILFVGMGLVSLTYRGEPERVNRILVCADCGHKWLMSEQDYQAIVSRPSQP
jgi:hypothetical protein